MPQRTVTTELPIKLWEFARDVSRLVNPARLEYLNRLLAQDDENLIVKELQVKYSINKRVCNAIRVEVKGAISSAKECRNLQLETIAKQIKSIKRWLKEAEKELITLKNVCNCQTKRNVRTSKRFAVHQKKRRLALLEQKLKHLKEKPLKVKLGNKKTQYLTVGSKGESFGNQITQYDGETITFRVPYALEFKYGKNISASLKFEYEKGYNWILDAISNKRALTYRIYCKDFRWFIAVSTDVPMPKCQSFPRQYGCLGLDINPNVIGWSYLEKDGNLKHHGQLKFNTHSRRSGQSLATLHELVCQIALLAETFNCPVVVEKLDFSDKKAQMRERGRKYSRMLSSFVYGKLIELLEQKCILKGIELIKINPAYSSLVGLVKFMRQYGLSSDTAAAMVLARRAMRLSERIPIQNAYPLLTSGKHVWTAWNALHKKLGRLPRHQYYTLSNRELEAMLDNELKNRLSGKPKGTSRRGANPQRNRK